MAAAADAYERRLRDRERNIIREPSPYINSDAALDNSRQNSRTSTPTGKRGRHRSADGRQTVRSPSADGDQNWSDDDYDDDDHTPSSPLQLSRDDVLSALGYKSDRISHSGGNSCGRVTPAWSTPGSTSATPSKRSDLCHRCGTKVYPVEKIDVGELYHRGCFKCQVCSIQLTLKSFHRGDVDAPTSGLRGRSRSEGGQNQPSRKAIFCKNHVPQHSQAYIDQSSIVIKTALDAQKKASDNASKSFEQSPYKYESDALEFQHARHIKSGQKVRRRSSLKTHIDYEKYGVYDEQKRLELKHREEEDELYRQIVEERKLQTERLEEIIAREKEKTVKELIAWFEERGANAKERSDGLQKVENYFAVQSEQRIKQLLHRMAVDEQAAVTRMIEKHAQEMLHMIEEKDKEVEETLDPEYHSVPHSTGRDAERGMTYKNGQESNDLEELNEIAEDHASNNLEEDVEEEEQNEDEHKQRLEDRDDDDEELSEEDENGQEGELDEGKQSGNKVGGHFSDRDSMEDNRDGDMGRADTKVSVTKPVAGRRTYKKWRASDEEESDEEGVAVAVETIPDVPVNKLKAATGESGGREKNRPNRPIKAAETQTNNRRGMREKSTTTGQDSQFDLESGRPSNLESRKSQKQPVAGPRLGRGIPTTEQTGGSRSETKEYDNRPPHPRSGKSGKGKAVVGGSLPSGQKIVNLAGYKLIITTERIPASGKKADEDSSDESVAESVMPDVVPPTCRKAKLYKNADVFKDFDKRAVKEAQKDPTSFTDLVRRLSHKCKSDVQKVRAIFRWITAKDLNKLEFSENIETNTPMGLLRGIKFGTETYHSLLKRLCSYAGLHCEVIEGYSKGVGYRPGSRIKDRPQFRNQWTAVWVDDSWRFVNCNWGARHVKRPRDNRPTYKIDEFYFLTDPEDHIYQHFPDDSRWQLLRNPISMDEFVRLPIVKSPFFNAHLSFVSRHTESVIKSTDGAAELRIRAPRLMGFAAKLHSKDGKVSDDILADRNFIRVVDAKDRDSMAGQEVVVVANLPAPGLYYWDIFVDSDHMSESMDNACSVLIRCTAVASSASTQLTFPQVGCFGRTREAPTYGIQELSQKDSLITCSGELSLDMKTARDDVRLNHTLRYWSIKERTLVDCDRFAVCTSRILLRHASTATATYLIRCPRKGIYVFTIFAANREDGANRTVVYRYLIDCRLAPENPRPLPHSCSRWMHCRLIEPLDGELPSKTKIKFRIETRAAKEIVACVNGEWSQFEPSGEDGKGGTWAAVVYTGDASVAKLNVFARFDLNNEKYIPLLEYAVKEASLTDEVRSLFKYM